MLKTSGYALGFQHSPRDLANVNEWKIMFDPYIACASFRTGSKFISEPFFESFLAHCKLFGMQKLSGGVSDKCKFEKCIF